ncbi:hypothetical protein GCM10022222_66540 [Amycolatopsis ultiminotia]|uniref:Uncharacterized protein n=1 Tax=Amycolatopsis ultiminotia TaxID=543629 RepID=A0ABP6XVH7_9PSEU
MLVMFTAAALAHGTRVAAFADDVARARHWPVDPHDALLKTALRQLALLLAVPSSKDDFADALRRESSTGQCAKPLA